MNNLKSLWASVRGDSAFMRRLNGSPTLFWILMIPVSVWTHAGIADDAAAPGADG